MLPRISLLLTALVFGGFGAVLFADPRILEHAGVVAAGPMGVAELRAFYGGLELGLAAFFLLAATRRAWHRPALVAQVLALGGSRGRPARRHGTVRGRRIAHVDASDRGIRRRDHRRGGAPVAG